MYLEQKKCKIHKGDGKFKNKVKEWCFNPIALQRGITLTTQFVAISAFPNFYEKKNLLRAKLANVDRAHTVPNIYIVGSEWRKLT